MKCRYCRERAPWWRRACRDCRVLRRIWQRHRFEGLPRILRRFEAAGVARAQIDRFLEAEPRGAQGSVRDQIAADMSNQLLDALGQSGRQSTVDVKRLRERGAWRAYDRRPEE